MKELHVSHPGVTRMKGLARGYVWWPKIDSDIERFVSSCSECQEQRPAPKPADLHSWQWPDRPWTRLHADYAGPCNGTYFLVIVDAFSKWVEVFPTTTTSSSVTITALRSCFSRFGLPVTFVTDNAAYWTSSEFKEFMVNNGISHITSEPYQPSTNGLAENMVKTLKSALAHVEQGGLRKKLDQFLFRYRVKPHCTTGKAPCELLLGRKVRTVLDLVSPLDCAQPQSREEAKASS